MNLHHHAEQVDSFLKRSICKGWLFGFRESNLLGTAGTLRAIQPSLDSSGPIMVIHADNWSHCDLGQFLNFHKKLRPAKTVISMMTFETDIPRQCGITKLDESGKLVQFYEKVNNPPGTRANAAIYIIEPEVIDWLKLHPKISDFSTEVIPNYLGRIACWHHDGLHRDIGTFKPLIDAQKDPPHPSFSNESDNWLEEFRPHSIHSELLELATSIEGGQES